MNTTQKSKVKSQKYNVKLIIGLLVVLVFIGSILAPKASAGPTSTNYELKNYGFGAGGTENSASTNYSVMGVAGEVETGGGLVYAMTAGVPPQPSLTNPGSYYNKLKIVISTGGNPADTQYAIAISKDNFAADKGYVQNDHTVGISLGLEDWQSYDSWGGVNGISIIGLDSGTTYYVKVGARQGNFTQSGFGPVASAVTADPNITFDIDVSETDSETDAPFVINFSDLLAGSIVDSPQKIWVDLATNGESGGKVYLYGQNGGLASVTVSHTIASTTGDLSALTEGFGAQGTSNAQISGGPLAINTPYNGSAQNVGVANTSIREIFTSDSPITGGRGSFVLKAKSSSTTPASGDYSETLTLIASAAF